MLEELKAEAQQALDDLYTERLIPVKLTAYDVIGTGMEDYIVHFHDSRMRALDLTFQPGESFQAVFRVALLERLRTSICG